MKVQGKVCRYEGCKTRVIEGPLTVGNNPPKWIIEGLYNGYCMKCALREFSNLVPVVNPNPDDEFEHFAIIDGEPTALVPKEEFE